jgi:prepilin-type N-terminal cleavage/methylation domain-containing protein
MKKVNAFSLVEVLIVVAILSVIAVTGYRSLMYLTKEATQTSRAAANSRRAEYDRFVGVLNDRLGQGWSYIAETATAGGLNRSILHLYNADGQNFADFGIYTDGIIYRYQIADVGGTAPLNLEYVFTNQIQTLDYALRSVAGSVRPPAPRISGPASGADEDDPESVVDGTFSVEMVRNPREHGCS